MTGREDDGVDAHTSAGDDCTAASNTRGDGVVAPFVGIANSNSTRRGWRCATPRKADGFP